MTKKVFFTGTCPKCKKQGVFNVIDYSSDNDSHYAEAFVGYEWREYDFFLFSISSKCNNCKLYVCANIAAIYDSEKNSTAPLDEYADSNGELIENETLLIEFDYPPVLPPQYIESPIRVNENHLYDQAKRCYDIHAWDAVGVLCRKIIDIATAKIWTNKFNSKIPTLSDRILKLLKDGDVFDKKRPLEEQLDFNNEKHKILYDFDKIRSLGNDASHSQSVFDNEDAEYIIILTHFFLKRISEISS